MITRFLKSFLSSQKISTFLLYLCLSFQVKISEYLLIVYFIFFKMSIYILHLPNYFFLTTMNQLLRFFRDQLFVLLQNLQGCLLLT